MINYQKLVSGLALLVAVGLPAWSASGPVNGSGTAQELRALIQSRVGSLVCLINGRLLRAVSELETGETSTSLDAVYFLGATRTYATAASVVSSVMETMRIHRSRMVLT